ncbi:hypothetical protein CHELA1G11_12744 [Hyphomicrobiales bacterium]|nr:hypothetical protein CHELA1G11_12744 [Hyphomicrobiales bacterium]
MSRYLNIASVGQSERFVRSLSHGSAEAGRFHADLISRQD